jgi:hypothetical protein
MKKQAAHLIPGDKFNLTDHMGKVNVETVKAVEFHVVYSCTEVFIRLVDRNEGCQLGLIIKPSYVWFDVLPNDPAAQNS